MTFLVRTPTLTVKQTETLRIILRLYHAQLLQDELAKGDLDTVAATEAVIKINDIFEPYYYMVNAARYKATNSPDGRVQLVLRESQWSEIWKLVYFSWSSDSEEGKKLLSGFEEDLASLRSAFDDPPLVKSDMLDAKPSTSGRSNTMLN